MTIFGVIRSPRTVLFGSGQRHALPELVRGIGKRVFICTDNRFSLDPNLTAIADGLRAAGIAVALYEGTIAELPLECIYDATEQARAFGPDIVMGVGGGSCLDIAKLVALGLSHPGPMSDFYGEFKVPGPVVPVIAVPTTAGTGSEATPVAVLGDPERTMKVGISSPFLIPHAAVCDPELTLTCPPSLTAIAGADALTHAIEAFTAMRREASPEIGLQHVFIGKNVFSDGQALLAIRALAGNLARAVECGSDLKAREQVMLGAFTAGQAFGVAGTAAAHAIQYPLGALTKTAHGLGVAALMPYVMEFNTPDCTPELAEIAPLFGVPQGGSVDAQAAAAIEAVAVLFARIGIPRTLAELGLQKDRLSWVAEQSLSAARLVKNNPRLLDRDGAEQIVAAAYTGSRTALR